MKIRRTDKSEDIEENKQTSFRREKLFFLSLIQVQGCECDFS